MKNGDAMRKNNHNQGMRYIGNGAALPNVPARDLSYDEVASLITAEIIKDGAALTQSGLYTASLTPAEEHNDGGSNDGTRD